MIQQRILLTYLLLASLIISIMVFTLPPVKAEPTTWAVDEDSPADFLTIQDAVGAANNGDGAQMYELTIEVSGRGGISPAVGPHIYEEGSEIVVTATDTYSSYGWLFEYWILDGYIIGKKHNNPLHLIMDKDHKLIAVFAKAPAPYPTPETTPSPSPLPEPSATPTPTPSPTASPEPTPEIPELPFWAILPLFMIATLITTIFYFKKLKR